MDKALGRIRVPDTERIKKTPFLKNKKGVF